MAPWREIFKIEELSFDELIQRDLDDSRVAHDLIPYLLGETGQHARFFPPVLAVLVPKREGRSGIAPRYPAPTVDGERISFGDLFDFQKAVIDGAAAGASHRDIALALFGARRTAEHWNPDGHLRARVRYCLKRGRALVQGGYRQLIYG